MHLCCGRKEVSYGKTVDGCVAAAQYSNDYGTKMSELQLALNCPGLCGSCRSAINQMMNSL